MTAERRRHAHTVRGTATALNLLRAAVLEFQTGLKIPQFSPSVGDFSGLHTPQSAFDRRSHTSQYLSPPHTISSKRSKLLETPLQAVEVK